MCCCGAQELTFSVNAHGIFSATGASERTTLTDLLDFLFDLELYAVRAGKFALCVGRLENGPVFHDDLLKPIWQVGVGRQPLLRAPVLVREDDFDEKEIRERVADRLVDEVYAGLEHLESFFLARVAWLVFLNGVERIFRKDDGSVAISLEVDADIELLCSVVKVFDASGCAIDLQLQPLCNAKLARVSGTFYPKNLPSTYFVAAPFA
jgi:hypothetical protein